MVRRYIGSLSHCICISINTTVVVLEVCTIASLLYLNLMFSNAEPSPLHTTTIVEKCTLKLVDDYKHMLCQATEPMSTFLEYIR
jgi:hypothetical protein